YSSAQEYGTATLCRASPWEHQPSWCHSYELPTSQSARKLRLAAALTYGCIPWIIILSTLTTTIGRKKTHIIVTVSCLIGYSILYFSKAINHIFVSQMFQGVNVASTITTSSEQFDKQNNIRSATKILFSKASLKPILLSILLICLYLFSGKLICMVYAIDILQKIAKDNWTAYTGMLILDCVTVASMYLGCFLSKILKRRTMLLVFTSMGIMFLFILSGYLYLVKLSKLVESAYVSISLLVGYSITMSCGPMIMASCILGELLPSESKCIFMCINALIYKLMFSTFTKISPYFFKYLEIHGTFLLYGILSVVFLVLIYFYIPETKNKTLHEIQESLKWQTNKSIEEISELLPVLVKEHNVTHA
ncbi:Sugar transporter, partial [Operophtera brumata]